MDELGQLEKVFPYKAMIRVQIIQGAIYLPAATKLRIQLKSDIKLLFHFLQCEKEKKKDMATPFLKAIYKYKEPLFKLFVEQAST